MKYFAHVDNSGAPASECPTVAAALEAAYALIAASRDPFMTQADVFVVANDCSPGDMNADVRAIYRIYRRYGK